VLVSGHLGGGAAASVRTCSAALASSKHFLTAVTAIHMTGEWHVNKMKRRDEASPTTLEVNAKDKGRYATTPTLNTYPTIHIFLACMSSAPNNLERHRLFADKSFALAQHRTEAGLTHAAGSASEDMGWRWT
jgi:hypothetical protein